MDIEIRKLSPELVGDYVKFFDETPHSDNIDEHKCYCVCWCGADNRVETDFSSAQKRRELAIEYVRKGLIQGYLAYSDGKAIGWCNANTKSDCLNCTSWRLFMQPFNELEDDLSVKIKSVFCFAIAPQMRMKGVARLLLERVCEDAKQEDFDFVEAYPNKSFSDTEQEFMGPKGLYECCGFSVVCEVGNKTVMRKRLG